MCGVLLCLWNRPEHTKAVVLPELVELARDEGSTVRLAAFDTIINLLEMFDSGELHYSFITSHLFTSGLSSSPYRILFCDCCSIFLLLSSKFVTVPVVKSAIQIELCKDTDVALR